MKSFYLLIVFILFNNNAFAQLGKNLVAPLQKDNFWIYLKDDYRYKYEVLDTNHYIDTIKYNQVFNSRFPNSPSLHRLNEDGFYAYRRDTTYPTINHEQFYYKKNAVAGDYWIQPHPDADFLKLHYIVLDTLTATVFGQLVNIKFINITDSGLFDLGQTWCDEFGLLYEADFWGPLAVLTGCYINGIVYGDTSLAVGVEVEPYITHNFKLYQNYPNPFNPVTKISWQSPVGSWQVLKVFDVLGREIATLVNEYRPAGNHTVEFNGAGLASGIYIYRLQSGDYINSKKMLLLK